MKSYDYVVIGGGVAGCTIAYELSLRGKSVAIVDRDGIASGASGCAGAFLSPLAGKANPYNLLVNRALKYSLEFYASLKLSSFTPNGVLRLANANNSKHSLMQDGSFLDASKLDEGFRSDTKGYFFDDAGVVDPLEVCSALTKGIDIYKQEVTSLDLADGEYTFDGIRSTKVILAQGVHKALVDTPYMKISAIYGVKVDATSCTKVPFNIHKNITLSATKPDGSLSIGATKERHDSSEFECNSRCDECIFSPTNDALKLKELLDEAQNFMDLKDLVVTKVHKGARATIKSYFPVLGRVVDSSSSLHKHPSIAHGTKIPPSLLSYYGEIFIFNALGSRAFVLAPYLAKLLADHLENEADLPKEVDIHKLFYKHARSKQ